MGNKEKRGQQPPSPKRGNCWPVSHRRVLLAVDRTDRALDQRQIKADPGDAEEAPTDAGIECQRGEADQQWQDHHQPEDNLPPTVGGTLVAALAWAEERHEGHDGGEEATHEPRPATRLIPGNTEVDEPGEADDEHAHQQAEEDTHSNPP